jgi:hypothetical protein
MEREGTSALNFVRGRAIAGSYVATAERDWGRIGLAGSATVSNLVGAGLIARRARVEVDLAGRDDAESRARAEVDLTGSEAESAARAKSNWKADVESRGRAEVVAGRVVFSARGISSCTVLPAALGGVS